MVWVSIFKDSGISEKTKNKKGNTVIGVVKYHEVINMTKHEKQFEERLNSLSPTKSLINERAGV